MYRCRKMVFALVSTGLCGCGLTVPEVGEFYDRDYPGDPPGVGKTPLLTATAQIEYEIKQKVYCELRNAVQKAEKVPVDRGLLIPDGWGVQMQLSLEVDESIALNPGLSFTQLYPNVVKVFGVGNSVTTSQSFSLGLGGSLSSQSFRTDKFNTYYSIKHLMDGPSAICDDDNGKPIPQKDFFIGQLHWSPAMSSPFLIQSNLGIKDWLIGAMYYDLALSSSPQPQPQSSSAGNGKFEGTFEGKLEGTLQGSAKGKFEGKTSSGGASKGGGGAAGGGGGSGFAQDSFTREIKFIIISSGNIQPTWKLVQVSANTGNSPFFSTGRTRTHDLLITVGPPTARTASDFLASQIGQATNR